MTDEEFVRKAGKVFESHKLGRYETVHPDALYLGRIDYIQRHQLVEVAKEILRLEAQD